MNLETELARVTADNEAKTKALVEAKRWLQEAFGPVYDPRASDQGAVDLVALLETALSATPAPTPAPSRSLTRAEGQELGRIYEAIATPAPKDEFTPTEWEVHTRQPEEMSVGKLNRVVRELREALYQQTLKTQAATPAPDLTAENARLREALSDLLSAEGCTGCRRDPSPLGDIDRVLDPAQHGPDCRSAGHRAALAPSQPAKEATSAVDCWRCGHPVASHADEHGPCGQCGCPSLDGEPASEPLNHAASCPRHDGLRCNCPKGDERASEPLPPTEPKTLTQPEIRAALARGAIAAKALDERLDAVFAPPSDLMLGATAPSESEPLGVTGWTETEGDK